MWSKIAFTLLYIITVQLSFCGLADSQADSHPTTSKTHRKLNIRIAGSNAHIHMHLPDSVTRLRVKNCARGTNICLIEDISVPEHKTKNEAVFVRDLIADVQLSKPHARMWTFYIWAYAGATLLDNDPEIVNVSCCEHDEFITTLLAAFVGVIIFIIIFALIKGIQRRRRDLKNKKYRKRKPIAKSDLEMQENAKGQSFKIKDLSSANDSSLYQYVPNIVMSSNIVLESVLSNGSYYQVWKGRFVDDRGLTHHIVVKKDKGCNEGYIRYLIRQAENMLKLSSHDHIVRCLGMTPDCRSLIMEVAPLGNLKQYLKARAEMDDMSSTFSSAFAVGFIIQIIEGVEAVHRLNPECLFYCLSCTNVLVSGEERCKLSGFANSTIVRHREEWEEKNNLPRPIQWLSPEAISLQHVSKSDIWSLGVLMWEVFSEGNEPFVELGTAEVKRKILRGEKLHIPAKCSQEIFDVMALCWMHDPKNRPSLNYISHSLLNLKHQDS